MWFPLDISQSDMALLYSLSGPEVKCVHLLIIRALHTHVCQHFQHLGKNKNCRGITSYLSVCSWQNHCFPLPFHEHCRVFTDWLKCIYFWSMTENYYSPLKNLGVIVCSVSKAAPHSKILNVFITKKSYCHKMKATSREFHMVIFYFPLGDTPWIVPQLYLNYFVQGFSTNPFIVALLSLISLSS